MKYQCVLFYHLATINCDGFLIFIPSYLLYVCMYRVKQRYFAVYTLPSYDQLILVMLSNDNENISICLIILLYGCDTQLYGHRIGSLYHSAHITIFTSHVRLLYTTTAGKGQKNKHEKRTSTCAHKTAVLNSLLAVCKVHSTTIPSDSL